MSSSLFKVLEHVIPCQHIRDYPHATLHSQEDVLQLAIKQYIPLDNLSPKPGDVTIIGAHANGFPKELYEPLWDGLLHRARVSGYAIRSIWIADVAHQGASGVLNEGKLGNDPSWFDHPRDLLHMVNTFRSQMIRPIIGIGHSMGGSGLINLALMHPRLLESLILIDPVVQRAITKAGNVGPAQASAFRRDRWPSRQEAAESFKKNKMFQLWEPRVLDLWVQYGLREAPTPSGSKTDAAQMAIPSVTTEPTLISTPAEKEVILTTTKDQEVFTFLRLGEEANDSHSSASGFYENIAHSDVKSSSYTKPLLSRVESTITFSNLPFLRPGVLYIFGSLSDISPPESRADKMAVTGTGIGGSGGSSNGRVKEVLLEGVGHLIPMERVGETADRAAEWIDSELMRWRASEKIIWEDWKKLPISQRSKLDDSFLAMLLGGPEELKKKRMKRERL